MGIPSCLQRALVFACEHVCNHNVLVVPCKRCTRQVQKRCVHLWSCHIHRSLPLHPNLQLMVDAYSYEGVPQGEGPKLTGVPFNDAYRYMDWLLTVPLLLIEILLVMKLEGDDFSSRAWTLGFGSALMIVSGYYGELVVTGDLTPRWMCWFLSMAFFLYIVYELLVGLSAATASEADPIVASKIGTAQVMTVIS